jgi:membrane-bound lytic murein transglycosylase B
MFHVEQPRSAFLARMFHVEHPAMPVIGEGFRDVAYLISHLSQALMKKIWRRSPLILAIALSACATPPKPRPLPPPPPPKAQTHNLPGHYSSPRLMGDFMGYREAEDFIARMVVKHGFPRDYLNGVLSRAQRKNVTLNLMNRQAGAPSTVPSPGAWSRYRAKFLTELHIESGAAFWRRHARSLQRASERYGVPPEYILGIMGVETIYGRNVGKDRVIDALATLAFDYPRRASYFAEELENYLLMTRAEDIDPLALRGSYAGAMGLGQFMPGSFLQWAVDHDGDGRRDLWSAEDAIGSIANYFAAHGWRRGEPVTTPALIAGGEVNLPTGYDRRYALADLAANGIRPSDPVAGNQELSLLLLRGADGDEYWLGHPNFYVITRYNHSAHYAMAVHQLAQAIKRRYRADRMGAR